MNFSYLSSQLTQLYSRQKQTKYILNHVQEPKFEFISLPNTGRNSVFTRSCSTFHSLLENFSSFQMKEKFDDLRISFSEDVLIDFDDAELLELSFTENID
ncbi:Hypothetical_protein [Hexamita inflata]|uniref:Hypothetical_protein n=1 Tax=Hexamita inflata TaxID=28002 RepID=A0AA86QW39_9EUKA|nr:Hypothetical protein HINF_LOCUS48443 [Hexamita inflata]